MKLGPKANSAIESIFDNKMNIFPSLKKQDIKKIRLTLDGYNNTPRPKAKSPAFAKIPLLSPFHYSLTSNRRLSNNSAFYTTHPGKL